MCDNRTPKKNIGIWVSEKKSHKYNWKEFNEICARHGYNLIRLDLNKPLECQGVLDVFLHKLTDILAAADHGDSKAIATINTVEQYISNHPDMLVIDSLDNVRKLLDRYGYYSLLRAHPRLQAHGVLVPAFALLTGGAHAGEDAARALLARGVRLPALLKPRRAHGERAHAMALAFDARGLARACRAGNCYLAQSFVNHDAVLYKVYIVGNRYYVCQRPSLKNFYPCEGLEPIYFTSADVCKADSNSTLSVLDPHEPSSAHTLDPARVRLITGVLKKEIGLRLMGYDLVVDNKTGDHAIIDINVFPGYDSYPDFFENLLLCIDEALASRGNTTTNGVYTKTDVSDNNGISRDDDLIEIFNT